MEIESISWKWNETLIENSATYNGFQLRYVYNEFSYTGEITLSDDLGFVKKVWGRRDLFTESAFLLVKDNILFIGLYSGKSTGCHVLAINIALSEVIWECQLLGLGSVGHSRYRNSVQMCFIDNKLFVFGWESSGKYIEILDPDSGALLLNRRI